MGVTCSGCGCDRTTSRPDISREGFPSASSSSKAKASEDCQESYFDIENVVTTRAPSSHRSDVAPSTSVFVAPPAIVESGGGSSQYREHGLPKLDLQRCAVEAQEHREHTEVMPKEHVPCGKPDGHEGGHCTSLLSPPTESFEGSSDRSPESPLLHQSPSMAESRGDEKKKKNRWRPSFRRLSKRSSTSAGEDRDGKKKPRSLRHSFTNNWSTKKAPSGRVRIKTNNANLPLDYRWLEATLMRVACNQANTLGAIDAQSGKAFTPLFFVIGGCPNYFCGMQAIAYFFSADGEVDFWWVKPSKATGDIEQATLSRHAKGTHKNDPGRSKPFYKPLADMFQKGDVSKDGRRFFIEAPPGQTAPRAIIEEDSSSKETRRRLWVHLVWQEDWTSNPLSRSRYIKGKLVYQRSPADLQFFAREYCIKDGVFTFSLFEDDVHDSVLPANSIKELYEPT